MLQFALSFPGKFFLSCRLLGPSFVSKFHRGFWSLESTAQHLFVLDWVAEPGRRSVPVGRNRLVVVTMRLKDAGQIAAMKTAWTPVAPHPLSILHGFPAHQNYPMHTL